MAQTVKYPGQLVFGLDIGTRSIVGTVGYKTEENFHVIAQEVTEHETRAMMDGQIHDIAKVGQTIAQVKEKLEAQLGRKLTDVCIAAAGRVLRTVTTHIDHTLDEERAVTQEDIYSLDMLGVEKAHDDFMKANDTGMKFYCVGYTVVKYFLNEYPMKQLENHKARSISADLIVTFLPDEVVDGLYKAVELAGLQVANLTLEPIAAIQVAIPEAYRMLNIALVDVGAGTSDICITKDGSIVAYGMIPSAGDELTEVIANHCLVDFPTAEKIKTEASTSKKSITYKDIMGLIQKAAPREILSVAEPVIQSMTGEIAEKIKELNGKKAVSAVFVVGGGGKIKGFTDGIAAKLGIHKDRVALRGEEVLRTIDFQVPRPRMDSMYVTPIGICMNFYDQKNNFIFVTINGERIKLYDSSRLSIIDAAMQVGLANDALFPKRGEALEFTINGKQRMVRGEMGEAAVITLNDEPASIHTPIHANDRIVLTESTAGADGHLDIRQLPEFDGIIRVIVNDKPVELPKFAQVNGALQSGYYSIQNGDEVQMLTYYTVRQIIEFMDVLLKPEMHIYVNNKRADEETQVYENFSVIWTLEELNLSDVEADAMAMSYEELPEEPPEDEVLQEEGEEQAEQEKAEEKPAPLPMIIHVTANQAPVTLKGKPTYVFVDIFDHIDFDLAQPQGRTVVTLLNGRKAQFTERLKEGDAIEIYWQE